MKIGVIGAGMIGSTAARLFAKAGNPVLISNSRGPESLTALAEEIGATPATVEEASGASELVLVAIPFSRYRDVPASALGGKIVVDANNYYPARDGRILDLDNESTTSSELFAEHLSRSRIVKAFNTIYFKDLAEQGNTNLVIEQRRAILISGDDGEAKKIVSDLIEQIGFAAVDMGSLAEGGRRQQPGSPLYNVTATMTEVEDFLSGRAGLTTAVR